MVLPRHAVPSQRTRPRPTEPSKALNALTFAVQVKHRHALALVDGNSEGFADKGDPHAPKLRSPHAPPTMDLSQSHLFHEPLRTLEGKSQNQQKRSN